MYSITRQGVESQIKLWKATLTMCLWWVFPGCSYLSFLKRTGSRGEIIKKKHFDLRCITAVGIRTRWANDDVPVRHNECLTISSWLFSFHQAFCRSLRCETQTFKHDFICEWLELFFCHSLDYVKRAAAQVFSRSKLGGIGARLSANPHFEAKQLCAECLGGGGLPSTLFTEGLNRDGCVLWKDKKDPFNNAWCDLHREIQHLNICINLHAVGMQLGPSHKTERPSFSKTMIGFLCYKAALKGPEDVNNQ